MSAIDRFERKAAKGPGCWLWSGQIRPNGYGAFWLNGRSSTAHRAAYQLFVGEVPGHLQVCHTCDVRACVNPAHLFLGTAQDNADDREAKGRTFRTWAPPQLELARTLRLAGHTIKRVSVLTGIPYVTVERRVR